MSMFEKKENQWFIKIDNDKCSICEMCAYRCPSHAIRIRRTNRIEELIFDYTLCDGCDGKPYCKEHCPEEAVSVISISETSNLTSHITLIKGEMRLCDDCGSLFIPGKKLEIILQKEKVEKKSILNLCPACRQIHLMEDIQP